MNKITLQNGKYTIEHNNGANLKALRYGEDWRDLTGDNLILALVQYIEELKDSYKKGYSEGWDNGYSTGQEGFERQ